MMRTGLFFVVLLGLCARCSAQECRQELLENVDFPGPEITFVFSPDVHHCQQMCTQHSSCLFFSFLRSDWTIDDRQYHCYLKETPSGEPKVQKPLLGVTSGYSLKPCPQTPAPCFDQVYTDIDFPGADIRSLFTADYEECQRACTRDLGCQFFTWVNGVFSDPKIRYKCHLKFSWTVTVPPQVKTVYQYQFTSGFSHNAQISASNQYLKECHSKYFLNVDIPGSNVLEVPSASPEHCQVLCSAHPLCTYFSHRGTTCFLKNNPNEMVLRLKDGVTSGLPSRFCQQDKQWLRSTYINMDLSGSDMTFSLEDNVNRCQKLCNDNPHCQFYTFIHSSHSDVDSWFRCWRKRVNTLPAPPRVTKLHNVVSGFTLENCGTASATGSAP